MHDTPGAQFLDYMGLTRVHPRWDEIAAGVDEAIFSAAEEALEAEKVADPSVAAMLDDRYTPWTKVTMLASELRVGCRVQAEEQYGIRRLCAKSRGTLAWERVRELGGNVGADLAVTLDHHWPIRTRPNDTVAVLVPVPFDLAPLMPK